MGRTIDMREPELESRVQAIADAIAQAAEEAAERAEKAWKESKPVRREAAKTIERQGREVGKWWRHTWRNDIRPGLRRAWNRRTVALASAGAAVPAVLEDAAAELGIRPRHERHWGAFVAGLIIGAITGAAIAILTAPKPGAEVRDEIASRARDVAESAGEWIPVSAPPTNGNGGSTDTPAATEVETES
jgi:gas vesicle protein